MVLTARTVHDLLKESMDKAILQFDLAITALSMDDKILANRVLHMEDEVEKLIDGLFAKTALSIRSPRDAEELLIYFYLGQAINAISDTASNLVEIVMKNINPFVHKQSIFLKLHDHVDAVMLNHHSLILGHREDKLKLKELFGIDIMAIKRDNEILLEEDIEFEPGDVVYLRGPIQAIQIIKQYINGDIPSLLEARKILEDNPFPQDNIQLEPFEEKLVKLIDITNIMIDIALISHLDDNFTYKNAVKDYENTIDYTLMNYYKDLMKAIIKKKISEPHAFALFSFGNELESLADAIFALNQHNKMRKWRRVNLLERILEESEENIELIRIDKASPYYGKRVGEVEVEIKVSGEVFDVVALKRKGQLIPYPNEKTKLEAGDVIIIKTYNE